MDQTSGSFGYESVIGVGPTAHGIEAGIELLPRGRAHGGPGKGMRESHALARQGVYMGCR